MKQIAEAISSVLETAKQETKAPLPAGVKEFCLELHPEYQGLFYC